MSLTHYQVACEMCRECIRAGNDPRDCPDCDVCDICIEAMRSGEPIGRL